MPNANAAWVDFKEIKSRVSIVQILERYGVLHTLAKSGNGDRLSGACPVHGGTNKTHFRASISRNCWNCFGKCQSGGNVIDLVSKKEGVSFRDAAILIQEWFDAAPGKIPASVQHPQLAESQVEERPHPCVPNSAPPEDVPIGDITENKPLKFELTKLDPVHEYLRERSLTEESIATFGLGYCGKGLLRGYIAIPIHNVDGGVVAYAGRWPGTPPDGKGKYKLPEGFRKSLEVFNLQRAIRETDKSPLVIVEGFFDCIALWQHGIRRIVALMGSSLSPRQEELIAAAVNPHSRILLMLDEDDAGRQAREIIAPRLAAHCYVKTFRFQHEGQQPDTLTAEQLAEFRT